MARKRVFQIQDGCLDSTLHLGHWIRFDLSFGQLRFSVVIFQLVLTSTCPENRHTASVFSVTFSGLKVCVAFIVGSCPTSAKWPRLSPSPITFTSERDNS